MNIGQWQSLIGLSLGLISFSGGILLWYKGAIEKRYASERAFSHIRNNQEQIINAIDTFERDFEQRLGQQDRELLQVKMLLTAILAKSGDSSSEILRSAK